MSLSLDERLQRALIRSEIEALNMEFAYLIDHNRSDEVPLLFTEDGSYGREGGGRSSGREALTKVYAMRAARGERTARHLFTNLRLEYVSEREVHGQTILLLYAEDGPAPHPAEANLVSDYRDVYRLGDDGRWRYASRTVTHQFKHPGNKPIVLPLGQA
jgi:hypothetical protein